MYHVPATQARLHHYRSKPLNCVFMFSVGLPQLKFYLELYFVWSLCHFKSSDSQCQYLNAEMPLQHRRQSDSPWYCQPCPDYSITLICKFVVPCHDVTFYCHLQSTIMPILIYAVLSQKWQIWGMISRTYLEFEFLFLFLIKVIGRQVHVWLLWQTIVTIIGGTKLTYQVMFDQIKFSCYKLPRINHYKAATAKLMNMWKFSFSILGLLQLEPWVTRQLEILNTHQ